MTDIDRDSYWIAETHIPKNSLENIATDETVDFLIKGIALGGYLLLQDRFLGNSSYHLAGGLSFLVSATLDNYTTYRTGKAMKKAEHHDIHHGLVEANPLLPKTPTLKSLYAPKSILQELVIGTLSTFAPPMGAGIGLIRSFCAYANRRKEQRLHYAITIHDKIEKNAQEWMKSLSFEQEPSMGTTTPSSD